MTDTPPPRDDQHLRDEIAFWHAKALEFMGERDTALAKVAEVERERNEAVQYRTGHLPTCGGMDEIAGRCACGYLQGDWFRQMLTRAEGAESALVQSEHNADHLAAELAREVTDEQVERIAHDFCQTCLHIPSWSKLNERDRKHVIDEMRAALTAALSPPADRSGGGG